jgi:hypothetical protein
MPNDTDPLSQAIHDQLLELLQEGKLDEEPTEDEIAEATSEVIEAVGDSMYQQVREDDEGL